MPGHVFQFLRLARGLLHQAGRPDLFLILMLVVVIASIAASAAICHRGAAEQRTCDVAHGRKNEHLIMIAVLMVTRSPHLITCK